MIVRVRFDVLGSLRVHTGDDVSTVSGLLRRNLLAVLLARANHPVSAEVLVDALWGGELDDGTRRLHVQVHRLRAILDDPERLSHGPAGYSLRVGPDELDCVRFARLVGEAEECDAHDPGWATDLLREALGLWRGSPYEGVDVPGLAGEIQRLVEWRLVAFEALYDAELRCGRHAAVVRELAGLVCQHPLRERLHALWMTALYQDGRRADALAAYRNAREILVDELGLEPGPELRALEQRILEDAPIEPPPSAVRRVVPAQLPHVMPGFVGRVAELSALDELLAGRSVVVTTVVGSAGVGKTSLAVHWAHRVRDRFPDGQLYVDLRGYGPDRPVSSADALGSFLRALGMDGAAVPHDPAERAARFRTLVDRKRLLIVLDNAQSAEQVRSLLPGTATCFVVVTSRDSLAGLVAGEGAHRIGLDRMSAEEAGQLLHELLGDRRDCEQDSIAQLVERCARLPLALRIAAERLRERPHRRVGDLVAELADEHARLDLLDSGDQQTSVRAVFAASYHHLDPAAARLFRLLGLHPGRDVDLPAVAALAGEDLRTARKPLEALVRANLVDETTGTRYVLHDLLWTYAAELAEATDQRTERRAAMARLLDHYARTASGAANPPDREGATVLPARSDHDAAIRWLEAERTKLLHPADVTPAVPVLSGISAHRQLPMDIEDFTGRDAELRTLLRHAEREDGAPVAITTIEGMAGVGKTRLAVHAAHEFVRRGSFDDIQLWADLRGFDPELPPVDPAVALESFLGLLGVPRQYLPAGLDERSALFRDRLAGKKSLILLDNAESASQVRPLLPGDAASSIVLVTSRRALTELDGAQTIRLSAPSTGDAVALLARIAGHERIAAEPDQATRLAELCGRLPLALALAARQLRNRPQWTLEKLADRLAAGGGRMNRLPGKDIVRTTFDLSYRALKPDSARLFRRLGLHYGDECCVGAAALLGEMTMEQAEDLLDELIDENLVYEGIANRYRLHDLIRGYARERAYEEDSPAEREAAVRRVLAGYLHTAAAARVAVDPNARQVPVDDIDFDRSMVRPFPTKDEGMAWYMLERSNLVAGVHTAADRGHPDIAWRFVLVLLSFFYLTKHWDAWVATHRAALDVCTKADDPEGQAHALNGLGVAYSDLHKWDESISCHLTAEELFTRIGNSRDGAWNLNNVGVVYDNLGRFADALRCYHAALVLFREVGDRRGEGLALNNLGDVFRQQGEFTEAARHLDEALAVQDAAGDRHAKRFTLGSLADLRQATGDHERAIADYRHAVLISRDLDDRRRIASLLHREADSLAATGNAQAERECLREALTVYTDLDDPTAEAVRRRLGENG